MEEILKEWLEFSKDIVASDFAGNEQLEILRHKTQEAIKAIPIEPPVSFANGEHIGECRMCFAENVNLHHFDLYVAGSEGIWICENCRTLITENIRVIKTDNLHKKFKKVKDSRLSS